MKKWLVLCACLLLFVSGCGEKEKKVIDVKTFTEKAEQEGLYVVDATEDYQLYSDVKTVILGQNDKGWQVEFYVYENEERAKKMVKNHASQFGKEIENSKDKSEAYDAVKEDTYMIISRIDNTVVYAKQKKEFKESIQKVVTSLGY